MAMAEEKILLEAPTDDYLRSLPGLKYPQALVDTFPRIANTIVSLRTNKPQLRAYFDSLLNDTRGGRQGFPFSVLMNIQDLREAMLGEATGFVLDDTTKWVS
jgi:hypothetical protein